MLTNDELFFLYLNNTPKMYPRRFNAAYFKFRTREAYVEHIKACSENCLSETEKEEIISGCWKSKVRSLIDYMDKAGIHAVFYDDEKYPQMLRDIDNPPAILYYIGDISLCSENSVAVVGSRHATGYGADVTDYFVREFVSADLTVISGMAEGIDACAHRCTVKHSGKTIAVLGSGIDRIYPMINEDIYRELCVSGLVLSEYPISSKPQKSNFPERNRLIIGLAKCLLVVEAGVKSGTMITVDFALEQGKNVYAVPGSIFSFSGKGVNQLIKSGCAVATEPEDILQEFGVYINKQKEVKQTALTGLDKQICDLLAREDCPFHVLQEKIKCDAGELGEALMMLEISGHINQGPGRIYSLKR